MSKPRATKDKLKIAYVKYFEDVPVQRYAAMYVGRDEDTIIRWRQEDPSFAESVQKAKAEWIRKRVITTKAEFALERLEKEVFSDKVTLTIEQSSYQKALDSLPQIDPNKPKWKAINQQITDALMEETRRSV